MPSRKLTRLLITPLSRPLVPDVEYRASSAQPSGPAYPLDDDGTVAAIFGFGFAPANAPAYHQVDYVYTGAAAGGLAITTPTLANIFGAQAIPVGAGVKLYCEAVVLAVPSQYLNLQLNATESSGGTPTLVTKKIHLQNADGLTPIVDYDGNPTPGGTPVIAAEAGYRVGMILDGDTGDVIFVSTDGVFAPSVGEFTPGNAWTFYLLIADAGGTPAAETCSIQIVPNAADMVLPGTLVGFPAGVTDWNGDPV